LSNIENCRAKSAGGFEYSQFLTRFLPHQPAMWLHMFTVHYVWRFIPSFGDIYTRILNGIISSGGYLPYYQVYFLQTPAGCLFDDYIQTGTCLVQYTGFQDLFQKDVTFRLSIEQCSNNTIPDIRVNCVGKDCREVLEPYFFKACQQDSDCPGGSCTPMPPIPTYFQDLLWPNSPVAETCDNPGNSLVDLLNLIYNLTDVTPSPPLDPSKKYGFCSVDLQPLFTDNPRRAEWIHNSTIVDDYQHTITITGLESYVPVAGEPAYPSTAIASSSTGSGPSSGGGSSGNIGVLVGVPIGAVVFIGLAYFIYRRKNPTSDLNEPLHTDEY